MSTSDIRSAGLASNFSHLWEVISWLELVEADLSEAGSGATASGSFQSARSNVSSSDVASQVTVHGDHGGMAPPSTAPTTVESRVGDKKLGGLTPDNEGRETRRKMLERRRKECEAEDVDVALAPVVKINVPYVFYPDQYKLFRRLFPRVNVDSGLNFTHHDHPVAHTATLVGIRLIQAMFKPGERVLDLHGNPNMNDRFNDFATRKFDKRVGKNSAPKVHTLVEMKTAADAVRAKTKWGPERAEDGERRWKRQSMEEVPAGYYDTFISIHTLYYYGARKVCEFLGKNPNAKLYALVNYEKNQSGTLYGELRYSKQNGRTVQTSPNGEKYEHHDIDYWFQQSSYKSPSGSLPYGIAWTSSNIGGPLYLLTITSCPTELAECNAYEPPLAPTLTTVKGGKLMHVVRIGGQDVQLRITNAEFAQELRRYMALRDRSDPQVFKDLCVKARRDTNPDALKGTRKFDVLESDFKDHVFYAYLVDVNDERQLLDGVCLLKSSLLDNHSKSLALTANDKEQGLIRSMLQSLIGTKEIKDALGARTGVTSSRGWLKDTFDKPPNNTGGLLPLART